MNQVLKLSDELSLTHMSNGGVLTIGTDNEKIVEIFLRTAECNILHYLYEHSGELVSKEQLSKIGWPDTVVGPNSLNVAISNLRKSLRQSELEIINYRSKGYKIEVERNYNSDAVVDKNGKVNSTLKSELLVCILFAIFLMFDLMIINSWEQVICKDVNSNSVECVFLRNNEKITKDY